jgi:acyl-coenzyme A synthetase/AMP-(fatty) acid ligase
MHLPLSQLLAVGRPPDHPVAVRAGESINFSRFHADVAHTTKRLKAADCRSGAPICRDSYWFMVGFLSLCHAGATIIMPANAQPGTLDTLAGDCDLLLADQAAARPGAFVLDNGQSPPAPLEPYDPDRVTVAFFTSGSTGSPKRITRTAGQLEREVGLVTPLLNNKYDGRLVSGTVSHQHVYGLIFRLLWPLTSGRPFSAITHGVWETALDELQPGGLLVTSPAHLSRMAGIPPLPSSQAPGQVLSAGAPLSPDMAREAANILGIYPTEIFGSTETGACASRGTEDGDTPWAPLPGVCFGQTSEGMLRVQSPALPDGSWVETADQVALQPDGGFLFQGRADRIVKIEGKRVSLPDVEGQLSALPWVDGAAVTIVHDRLAAVVVANGGGKEKLADLGTFRFSRLLRKALADTLEPAGLPRLWRFVDALPLSDMGKRRETDLQDLFTKGEKS